MSKRVKAFALHALTHETTFPLWRHVMPASAIVLTLHRFKSEEVGSDGHSPSALRSNLAYLRRQRFSILSLTELLDRVADSSLEPVPTVAFTVDDGYADFHLIAAPIFAEFDCPVTVFMPTGFIDRQQWLWWDVLEYAFSTTTRKAAAVRLSLGEWHYTWHERSERSASARHLAALLERVSDAERMAIVRTLPAQLDVEVPRLPPDRFASMSWTDARHDAQRGVTFGPHTVSHPIIAHLPKDRVREEMVTSWRRLREETEAAVPIFAIPNGQPYAFGSRDVRLAQEVGLRACVSTIPDYIPRQSAFSHPTCFPRFPYSDDKPHFVQLVTGLEGAKSAVRDGLSRFRLTHSRRR